MGEMMQEWSIDDVQSKINNATGNEFMMKVAENIFRECVLFAKAAKNGHTYNNYSGELESSVGVIVLKDRSEIMQWSLLASSGSDPAEGLQDMRNFLYDEIIGKSELPDGTNIPALSVVGIVFAAAPYAGDVESRGRKVLIDFAPSADRILKVIKEV